MDVDSADEDGNGKEGADGGTETVDVGRIVT